MIQQQLHGGSFIAVLHRIIATKGLFHRNGLMRGLIGTSCRDAIYVTGMLTMTPILQDHFIKYYDQSRQLAGLYSSIISGEAILTYIHQSNENHLISFCTVSYRYHCNRDVSAV